VVKGYSQIAGLDFNETFDPVVGTESIRVIFAIAAANDLYILHIGCKNAFLPGESDVEIFVLQPEGFVDELFPEKVLYLNKAVKSPFTALNRLLASCIFPLWGGIRSQLWGNGNGFLHSCSREHPSRSL